LPDASGTNWPFSFLIARVFSGSSIAKLGALADLLLVDGNPLENINLIADPAKNFKVIMKDGRVYKNTL